MNVTWTIDSTWAEAAPFAANPIVETGKRYEMSNRGNHVQVGTGRGAGCHCTGQSSNEQGCPSERDGEMSAWTSAQSGHANRCNRLVKSQIQVTGFLQDCLHYLTLVLTAKEESLRRLHVTYRGYRLL